jgi:hypothetical protein
MCLKELRQNQTLQTAEQGKNESIAEQIDVVSCPNECSGNGVCENGKKKPFQMFVFPHQSWGLYYQYYSTSTRQTMII